MREREASPDLSINDQNVRPVRQAGREGGTRG